MNIKTSCIAATVAIALTGCNKEQNTQDGVQGPIVDRPTQDIVTDLTQESVAYPNDVVHHRADDVSFEFVQTLPTNTKRNSNYYVTLRITNNSDVDIDGFDITGKEGAETYYHGIFKHYDHVIKAGHSFEIKGRFVSANDELNEHDFILSSNSLNQSLQLTHTTNVTPVVLQTKIIEGLPQTVKKGPDRLPFMFEFLNDSDVPVEITSFDMNSSGALFGMTVQGTDTCKTLPAKGSCVVTGSTVAEMEGYGRIALTANYEQGYSVTAESFTNVTQTGFIVNVKKGLPKHTRVNEAYEIQYDVVNASGESQVVEDALITSDDVHLNIVKNDCSNHTLLANQTCAVTARVRPTTSGTFAIKYLSDQKLGFTGFDMFSEASHYERIDDVTLTAKSKNQEVLNILFGLRHAIQGDDVPKERKGYYGFKMYGDLQDKSIVTNSIETLEDTALGGLSKVHVVLDGQPVEIYLGLEQWASNSNMTTYPINNKRPMAIGKEDPFTKVLYATVWPQQWQKIPEGKHVIPLTLTGVDDNGHDRVTIKFNLIIKK